MRISRKILLFSSNFYLIALAFIAVVPTVTFAATTPDLMNAATYGILSSTYVNTSTSTTINGNIGFTTAPAATPGGSHTHYGPSAPYAAAGGNQGAALSALDGRGCDFAFAPGAVDLASDGTHGLTGVYTPGVYCIDGAASIGTTGIILSGAGTYIFRVDGALNTVASSTITLTNNASACDVFWTPNGATTLNANSKFIGTVIPVSQDITVLSTTIWTGRALTFGHTVITPDSNVTITVPSSCLDTIVLLSFGGDVSSIVLDTCTTGDNSASSYDGICNFATSNSGVNTPIPVVFTTPPSPTIITVVKNPTFSFGTPQATQDIIMLPVKLPATGAPANEKNIQWLLALGCGIMLFISTATIALVRKYT